MTILGDAAAQSDRQAFDRQAKVQLINGRSFQGRRSRARMLNRHFSIYLVAYILPAAVGFFAVTAYTRLLTPAEYGVYVVGISIAGILGAIFFAWIKLSVSRYQAMSAEVDFRGTAMVAFALTVAVHVRRDPAGVPVPQRRQCRAGARQHVRRDHVECGRCRPGVRARQAAPLSLRGDLDRAQRVERRLRPARDLARLGRHGPARGVRPGLADRHHPQSRRRSHQDRALFSAASSCSSRAMACR